MPDTFVAQNAFNGGELAPEMLGRSDVPPYQSGLRRCENWIPTRPGGLERRPGTFYVSEVADSARVARLLRFVFSDEKAFVLLWNGGLLRFYTDGAQILFATHAVSAGAIFAAPQNELTIPNHGYRDDVIIALTSTGTLPTGLLSTQTYSVRVAPSFTVTQSEAVDPGTDRIELGSGHTLTDDMGPFHLTSTGDLPGGLAPDTDYYVVNVDATSVQLAPTRGGAAVNITSDGSRRLTVAPTREYQESRFRLFVGGSLATFSGNGTGVVSTTPTPERPFEIEHSYADDELFEIQTAGDKDVLYIAHANHPVRRLVRLADDAWRLEDLEFEDGPYLDIGEAFPGDERDGITLTASATSGDAVVVSASQKIFRETDVGRAIRIGDDSKAGSWGYGIITGVGTPSFDDTNWNDASITAINVGADTVTITGSAFRNAEGPVRVDTTQYGLSTGVDYWLHRVAADDWSFHTSEDDAINDSNRVDITDVFGTATVVTSAYLNLPAHGIPSGDVIRFETAGSLTTGLSTGQDYFVRVIDEDFIAFSETADGPLVAIALADGTGTHFIVGSSTPLDQVIAKVDSDNEFPLTTPQQLWRLGAFSPSEELGFPRAVTLHQQRLVLGGAVGTPQTVYGSVAGDPNNFGPDQENPNFSVPGSSGETERSIFDSSSWTFRLNSETLNVIQWLASLRVFYAGTAGGLFHVSGGGFDQPITPSQVNARRGTEVGAARAGAVIVDDAVAFIDDSQRAVQRAEFQPDTESIGSANLNALASHLGERGALVELTRSGRLLPLLWVVRDDGKLLSTTLDTEQGINAWAVHTMGGLDARVESIEALPSFAEDEVWVVVSRTLGGQTVRSVEYLAPRFDEASDDALPLFLDMMPQPYDGPPVSSLSAGLEHFPDGTVVSVVADGGSHPDVTVGGGAITLDRTASKIIVGFHSQPVAELLPVETDPQAGTSLALRETREIRVGVRLLRTRVLSIGTNDTDLEPLLFRSQSDPMDSPPPLFTGLKRVNLSVNLDDDKAWRIVAPQPLPAKVLAAVTRLEFAAR